MNACKERFKVRAEYVNGACGSIGHMTADEIKRRTIGQDIDLSCPACGMVHLSADDAWEAAVEMIVRSARYKRIYAQAI